MRTDHGQAGGGGSIQNGSRGPLRWLPTSSDTGPAQTVVGHSLVSHSTRSRWQPLVGSPGELTTIQVPGPHSWPFSSSLGVAHALELFKLPDDSTRGHTLGTTPRSPRDDKTTGTNTDHRRDGQSPPEHADRSPLA